MTKKYHVFSGDNYYPSGAEDYRKSFETKKEAISYAKSLGDDWWEIMETLEDGSLLIVV